MKNILIAANMQDAASYIRAGKVPANLAVLTPERRQLGLRGISAVGSVYVTAQANEGGVPLALLEEVRMLQARTCNVRGHIVLEQP